ncbi:14137_t:CDS:2, partial [Acaulospora colombiana]
MMVLPIFGQSRFHGCTTRKELQRTILCVMLDSRMSAHVNLAVDTCKLAQFDNFVNSSYHLDQSTQSNGISSLSDSAKEVVDRLWVVDSISIHCRAIVTEYSIHQGRAADHTQAQCTQHLLDRRSEPLLVVLPMGHGKSLIYQLPVFWESAQGLITIVIVPLLSLAQAACHSAKSLGLRAHFINPKDRRPGDSMETLDANLLFCTYDLLLCSEPMRKWIHLRTKDRRISRIVVDEVHTIITEKAFRTVFISLATILKDFSIPLVFLTGTLPLSVEWDLIQAFSNCATIPSVRLPTDRLNLSYQVSSITGEEKNMQDITDLFEQEIRPRLREDYTRRAIFFVQTVPQAHAWAARLHAG